MNKKVISYLLILLLAPALVLLGVTAFRDERYNLISLLVAVLACIPFFVNFEKGRTGTAKMIIIAVMTAVVAATRAIPAFKPTTAVIIITAVGFGAESGFLVGALSAVVSNMFLGQGPWTPIQMFAWGIVGFFAGVMAEKGWLNNIVLLVVYGVIGAALYSVIVDLWSVVSMNGGFNWGQYIVYATGSLPYTAKYAAENAVFLIALKYPVGAIFERIKTKYNIV